MIGGVIRFKISMTIWGRVHLINIKLSAKITMARIRIKTASGPPRRSKDEINATIATSQLTVFTILSLATLSVWELDAIRSGEDCTEDGINNIRFLA